MRPLYQRLGIVIFTLVLLWSWGQTTRADDFCSLRVRVLDPDGDEVPATVTVAEPDGRTIKKDNVPGGITFCDLGINPVIVSIGEGCNQVVVHDVPLLFGKSYTLKVIYDPQPCFWETPRSPAPHCTMLLRIGHDSGEWVKGAKFRHGEDGEKVRDGDQYGRIVIRPEYNQTVKGFIEADGYVKKDVTIECTPKTAWFEQKVTLRKAE